MDFEWSADEQRPRRERQAFVTEVIPLDWTLCDRDMLPPDTSA